MSAWQPTLTLADGARPLFLRIAQAVIEDVRRGRLKPGDRLPGSRRIAESLEIHRNTVVAALAELESQGWLRSEQARGTFVAEVMPGLRAPPAERSDAPGFALPSARVRWEAPEVVPPTVRDLSAGMPDPRHFPVDVVSRAWRRVVRQQGRKLLGYGDPRGHAPLREALCRLLAAERGVVATPGQLLVTRGSQMALDLTARVALSPGDAVIVEGLGYRPAWQSLEGAGARLVPLPVDEGGMDIGLLEAALSRSGAKALYVTPHHQFPTTGTLSGPRRLQLMALARKHRLLVIEDDYDHEFHYAGRPVWPLASADPTHQVIHIGTLSKVLAPGLRLGFMAGPSAFIERAAALRQVTDRQGDTPMEATVAELIAEGELQRHIRKMRLVHLKRREALVEALQGWTDAPWRFEVPEGGIALWLQLSPELDLERWRAACLKEGVRSAPGARYALPRRPAPHATRLVFARWSERELAAHVLAMRRAAEAPGVRTSGLSTAAWPARYLGG